jgi:hypothetical protein
MEWKPKEFKEQARALIKKDYWSAVFAGLALFVCATDSFLFYQNTGAASPSSSSSSLFPSFSEFLQFITSAQFFYSATFVLFLTFFFSVFVGYPMEYGARSWFYHHGEGKGKEKNVLFSGFRRKQWLRVSACILWRNLIVICWGLLLIVPGVIKSYEYKFVPYILEGHPLMSAADVMKTSSNMTKGHKMELFKLDLSFIGWFLLQIVTLNFVGFFYAGPYFYQTQALAYQNICASLAAARKEENRNKKKQSRH